MVKRKISRVTKVSRAAKTSNRTTRSAPKRTTPKGSAAKRAAPKKKKAVTSKPPSKQAAAPARKPAAGTTAVKRKRPAARPAAALGRPKVPATADLDQMFLKDYEARQVFEFLGVRTVKDLEEHPPQEIIDRLTGPLVQTVDRIRKALAVNNRYLAGDQQFAVQFCQQIR